MKAENQLFVLASLTHHHLLINNHPHRRPSASPTSYRPAPFLSFFRFFVVRFRVAQFLQRVFLINFLSISLFRPFVLFQQNTQWLHEFFSSGFVTIHPHDANWIGGRVIFVADRIGSKTDRVCVILQTAAAPVAATLLLGGTVLYPRTAFAEAPESYVS